MLRMFSNLILLDYLSIYSREHNPLVVYYYRSRRLIPNLALSD
jgi:hypothetical protein